MAGAALAGASYSVGSMFTSMGNAIAFGDPLPTTSEAIGGLAFTMVSAGVLQGINAKINGRGFWTGKVIPQPVKVTMPLTGITPKTSNPDEMVAAAKSHYGKMSEMPSNAAAQSDALPMQGKVMNTVNGPDGQVTYNFESPKTIRNGNLAGTSHPKTGIPFDEQGFPDFSKNLYKGGPNDIMIDPTGGRGTHYSAANKLAGYTETPQGFTWHHHQTTGRMQLVDYTIHRQTGHTGGFSLWNY